MEILNQLPISYVVSGLIAAFILMVYIFAKVFQVKEGIFPQFWKLIARFSEFVSGEISLVGHFLFGVLEEQVDEFFANERNLRNSAKLFKIMALVIMCLTFYASFNSITEFFESLGFTLSVARTLAIANDTFIGLAVVYRMYHAFKGQASMSGSISLFFFTALSFYFNIRHAADGSAAYWYDLLAGGGLAPLGLFISVEFMSKVIQSQTYREGAVRTDHQLALRVQERREELDKLEAKFGELLAFEEKAHELETYRKELSGDIAFLEKARHQLDEHTLKQVPNSSKRLDQVREMINLGMDQQDIATKLEIGFQQAGVYYRVASNGKG